MRKPGSQDRAESETVPDPGAAPVRAAPVVRSDQDRYVHLGELGRGGMGRVVEAFDRVLGRTVALKEVLSTSEAAAERFRREIAITAYLEHPAIVAIHDAGVRRDGRPFYVMRKIEGTPLEDAIVASPTLADRLKLIPHVIATADALAHAHARGVIHRDLKPNNIIIGELGETVVIDWGLAIRPSTPETPSELAVMGRALTRGGTTPGTPGFMSPEQARGERVDARSDVYALGACLYYVLAGALPCSGDAATVLAKTIAGDIPPLAQRAPGVPPELVAIVERAMTIEREARYLDAGGFGVDVRRFLEGQLVAAHRYSARQRIARWVRRRRELVGIGSAALLVVALIGGFAIRRVVDERDRAEVALAAEQARSEELLIAQAERLLPSSAAEALATLRELVPSSPRWPRLAGLVLEARMRGVGIQHPGHGGLTTLAQLARRGPPRLLTTGNGEARILDLETRATEVIATGDRSLRATWWEDRVVIFDRSRFEVVTLDTGMRTPLRWRQPIATVVEAGDQLVILDREGDVATLSHDATEPVALGVRADSIVAGGAWLVVHRATGATLFERGITWHEVGELPAGQRYVLSPDHTRLLVISELGGGTEGCPSSSRCSRVVELGLPSRTPLRTWTTSELHSALYLGDTVHTQRVDGTIERLHDDGSRHPIAMTASFTWPGPNVQEAGAWVAVLREPRAISLSLGALAVEVAPPIDLTAILAHGDVLVGIGGTGIITWSLSELLPTHARFDAGTTLVSTPSGAILADRSLPSGQHQILRLELAARPLRIGSHELATIEDLPFQVIGDAAIATGVLYRFTPELAPASRFHLAVPWNEGLALGEADGTVSVVRDQQVVGLARLEPPLQQLVVEGGWLAVATPDRVARFDRTAPRGDSTTLRAPIVIASDGSLYGACAGSDQRELCRWDGTSTVRLAHVEDQLLELHIVTDRQIAVVTRSGAVELVDDRGGTRRVFDQSSQVRFAPAGDFAVALRRRGGVHDLELADLRRVRSWRAGIWASGVLPAIALSNRELLVREATGMLWRFELVAPSDLAAWVRHR